MSLINKYLACFIILCLSLCNSVNATTRPDQADNFNFMTIADIHFDPFSSCTTRPCPLIDKLRQSTASDWGKILAVYDKSPPVYGEDANYPLLQSGMLEFQKIAATRHARFVLVLGDFIGHYYPYYYRRYSSDKSMSGYRSFVYKTLAFLTIELNRAFPDINVYAVVGNNDTYQKDYESEPGGQFFHDTANLWAGLIRDKVVSSNMRNQYLKAGYYSVTPPVQHGLRIIMLNTNLFSHRARGHNIDQAALTELNWLHNQLQDAKKNGQKVLIAMHIPEGIDVYATLRVKLFTLMQLWKSEYTSRFEAELRAFAPEISGILAGHLHADWFQILSFDENEIPVLGTPSISPIFGNNPGFKVFTYTAQPRQLQDYTTYYYPLHGPRAWGMEYEFNRIYTGTHCNSCPLVDGMSQIQKSGTLADYYRLFYGVKTDSQPIVTKWYPYYWCAIWNTTPRDYRMCID
jgi:sphingomyelin phosphodiesterase acid-like 3